MIGPAGGYKTLGDKTDEILRGASYLGRMRYVNKLVNRIDAHGSYEKHVLGIGNKSGREYGSLFQSKSQWRKYISGVIKNPSSSFVGPEKDLFWDDGLGTIVINNKTGGPPTAFKPQEGKQYYLDRVAEQQDIINRISK